MGKALAMVPDSRSAATVATLVGLRINYAYCLSIYVTR